MAEIENPSEQITSVDSSIAKESPSDTKDGEGIIHSYPAPLEKLLTYGMSEDIVDGTSVEELLERINALNQAESMETDDQIEVPVDARTDTWPDYLTSGITTEHIPDLLHMIADPALRTTDDDDDPKYWTALHAWRTLGQLRDVSAVAPLLKQSQTLLDDVAGFGDWALEELPDVYKLIGPPAIPVLIECIADASWPEDTRENALIGLEKIGTRYPESKTEIVTFFTKQLEQFAQNSPEINAYLVGSLVRMKAIETLPLIQQVFASDNIDTFFVGLEDVEVAFGLRERPKFSLPWDNFAQTVSENAPEIVASEHSPKYKIVPDSGSKSAPKGNKSKDTKKSKAKMEKKSRKKNRRK